jgi:hypothetical protein
MNIFEKIAALLIGAVFIFVLYIMLILLPVAINADSKCLAKGYPKASVTFSLDAYCVGINGAVNNSVIKL